MNNRPVVLPVTSPVYGKWRAAVLDGRAIEVGERYDVHGILRTGFIPESGYAENPRVTIGDEFLTRSLREYRDWPEKWWREAIQNSVDAQSTKIICKSEILPDGVHVECDDDGIGMDESILVTKFLHVGGTTKVSAEGAIGGFGIAKELLLFPWISWEVHSRDMIVIGQGMDYEIGKASYRRGTRLSVIMPSDRHTTGIAAKNYIKKCWIPHVKFEVSYNKTPNKEDIIRERVDADLKVGDKIRELPGKANVYYDKDSIIFKEAKILIRANGLHMFERSIWGKIPGVFICEIIGRTTELLEANRNGFRDSDLSWNVDKITGEIAKHGEEIARQEKGLVRRQFKGKGKFFTEREQKFRQILNEKLFSGPSAPVKVTPEGKVKIEREFTDQIEQTVRDIIKPRQPEAEVPKEREDEPSELPVQFSIPEEAVKPMLSITFDGPAHIEAAAKQMAWEPDYYLINEVGGWFIPQEYWPQTMTPKVLRMVRFWAELCRFVLIQLKCGIPYGIGCVFTAKEAGMHLTNEDGEHFLLFNPFFPKERKGEELHVTPQEGELYDLDNDEHIFTLYAVAVHEATHMADGLSYHDETFAAALTYNFAKTGGMEKQIREILKAVKGGIPLRKKRELTPEEGALREHQKAIRSKRMEEDPQFFIQERTKRLMKYGWTQQDANAKARDEARMKFGYAPNPSYWR